MSTEPESETNTKYVQLNIPVPRDLEAYSRTDHFRQRQKYRKDPEIDIAVVEECIQEGWVKGVSKINDNSPDDSSYIGKFAFDRRIDGHDWRVIVGVHRDGFLSDETHAVITAYCRCHSDDPEEVCPGA